MASTRRVRHRRRPIRSSRLQLAHVNVPTDVPNTTAIFIVLRKMRPPLVLLLAVMTISVIGLTLMPGLPQPDGSDGRLTVFDAFYVFSYTATTIGYGETPHEFSVQQRWWVVASIYMSVVGWAYTIARLMSLLQDSAFNSARATQAVRRTIAHMREPFVIIVGYGYIGRSVTRTLDQLGRRIVVLDNQASSIERLATDMLTQDVPGVTGDARNPAILGLAGLSQPDCEAVLAMTGDEEVNLQIVMTCSLLRPELPVIARASSRRIARAMTHFSPTCVINPFDDYGQFLILSLKHPHTHRLVTWLMSEPGTELGPFVSHPPLDKWLVLADGQFGEEIAQDLSAEGYEVELVTNPSDDADFSTADAVIAGAESDTTNLALAAHLRHEFPHVFIVVRQQSHSRLPLLSAFLPDSVFFPPRLISQRAVATLITPRLWGFWSWLMSADEGFTKTLTDRLVARIGTTSPWPNRLTIGERQTPAVARWLNHREIHLGAIMRSPQDFTRQIAAYPLLIIRDGESIHLPDNDHELHLGDEIIMVGTADAFAEQMECLYDDSTLFYTVTGRDIPTSRAWRRLTNRRWRDAFPEPGRPPKART